MRQALFNIHSIPKGQSQLNTLHSPHTLMGNAALIFRFRSLQHDRHNFEGRFSSFLDDPVRCDRLTPLADTNWHTRGPRVINESDWAEDRLTWLRICGWQSLAARVNWPWPSILTWAMMLDSSAVRSTGRLGQIHWAQKASIAN